MLRPQGPDPVTGTGLTQQLETPTPTGRVVGHVIKSLGVQVSSHPCPPLPPRAVSVLPPSLPPQPQPSQEGVEGKVCAGEAPELRAAPALRLSHLST